MPLELVTTTDENLISPEVERRVRDALARRGRAVLLAPSFSQALEAQRALAEKGLSLGITATTPAAWAEERWGVWGDGRRFVDDASRAVLARRVLSRAAWRPGSRLTVSPGAVSLLADLARVGLPWLVGAGVPEGVTKAESELVGLVGQYAAELRAHGLIEPCEALSVLPRLLAESGVSLPPVMCVAFTELSRAERELVRCLAERGDVTLVLRLGEGPAFDCARTLLAQLEASGGALVTAEGSGGADSSATRAAELADLLAALFCADEPVVPTGAVSLLLPAGPSAEAELVAREVRALAEEGARDIVVVSPDPTSAWRSLAPRLAARDVSVRAQLSDSFGSLECGRAYLDLICAVAHLVELDQTWPPAESVPDAPRAGTVRVRLADMSWWPPRDLSDFLLSRISHTDAARARALDREWRANRLLTPRAVLETLQSTKAVSAEVASAVRELLRGRLGSAASKLLAPYVQGDKVDAPEAPEARAVLSAVLDVARSLKELGLSADPADPAGIGLPELVDCAVEVLSRTRVSQRPEHAAASPRAVARIMGPRAAGRLAPASVDAVVLLGQSSVESAVSSPDDVRSALLVAYGVEDEANEMDRARAEFASTVRAARRSLVLERLLYGPDGKACYPSVMLTELLACYGLAADAPFSALVEALGKKSVRSRTETLLRENAAPSGIAPERVGSETPSAAGRIDPSERACVSPPPEGILTEGALPILSASQIESYLECPYKWFSLRRLRLRDADAGFTGAEMGTFAHRVLEVTRRELLARAVERELGGRELADMRAESPDAMQRADYRERVETLVAWAQERPEVRLAGSSVRDEGALEEARAVLEEEFDAHLSHQYQLDRRGRPLPQALVAHSAQQMGQLQGLRRDLLSLLDFEAPMLTGFEPRLFEWGFGKGGAEVSYAGVLLTGTIDRVDVDAHGQAVVIDYKHKSDAGFAAEYDVIPKGGFVAGEPVVPRRVQSLIYAQVVRRAFPQLKVRAATYLCTKGAHALAGAVDENLVDNVFGGRAPSPARLERVSVSRDEDFGREEGSGMEALLDACEEAIAGRISRMLSGDIEAHPTDADACLFCPVLNCERRLSK